jgi:hypothetical protein
MLLTSVFMLLCSAIGVPGVRGVAGREDADLHVEPLVAVDDVVAAAAHDEVAAVAAQDDVARRVAHHTGAQHGLQAVDARDARRVERAARIAFGAALRERQPLFGQRVGAGQHVGEARAREALDRLVPVQRSVLRRRRVLVEHDGAREVGIDAGGVVLVGHPVPARHAGQLAAAGAAHHDVVAALGDELVEAAVAQEHVVAHDAVAREDLVEAVAGRAVEGAGLDPVVALVAQDALGVLAAQDEVVALAGEHLGARVGAQHDEVLPLAAHDEVQPRAAVDHVVAVAGLDVVVAAQVAHDVVARAGIDDVVAGAAFQALSLPPSP